MKEVGLWQQGRSVLQKQTGRQNHNDNSFHDDKIIMTVSMHDCLKLHQQSEIRLEVSLKLHQQGQSEICFEVSV